LLCGAPEPLCGLGVVDCHVLHPLRVYTEPEAEVPLRFDEPLLRCFPHPSDTFTAILRDTVPSIEKQHAEIKLGSGIAAFSSLDHCRPWAAILGKTGDNQCNENPKTNEHDLHPYDKLHYLGYRSRGMYLFGVGVLFLHKSSSAPNCSSPTATVMQLGLSRGLPLEVEAVTIVGE